MLPLLGRPARGLASPWMPWSELERPGDLRFATVDFDHPLWILYSSGTTGLPKPIVHGHGGILIEHAKTLHLHLDLGPADRFLWFTTTGWMMWNLLTSGLLTGAAIVLYDGEPTPDARRAVGRGRRDRCHRVRHQRGVVDRLHEGRDAADRRSRSGCAARAGVDRITAARRGL